MASGAKNPKLAKAEVRQAQYGGNWATDLSGACVADPGWCCLSIFCSYCVSYHLRKRALYGDMSRYVCCNGDWPCSGRCGEQNAPQCCLCMEVVLCFPQSVASTRWMLQDEMRLRNTQCDNCIIGTTFAAQYLACLCWCAACITGSDALNEAARIIDWIAECLWCSACACMQTQAKVQLDARDANPSLVQPPVPMMFPPQQQQMVQPQAQAPPPGPSPPAGAYPPQYQSTQYYGQPPPPAQYYPPPPPQGGQYYPPVPNPPRY